MGLVDFARGAATLSGVGLLTLMTRGEVRYRRWEARPNAWHVTDALIVPGLRLSRRGEANAWLTKRVQMATRLQQSGWAPRLVLSGGMPRNGITEAGCMKGIAVSAGAPAHSIILEESATSTADNARYSAQILHQRGWRSAMIISDRLHLGYAVPVFAMHFEALGLKLAWASVGSRSPPVVTDASELV